MSQLKSLQEKSVSIKTTQAHQLPYQLANFGDKRLRESDRLELLNLPLLLSDRSKHTVSTGSILLDSLAAESANRAAALQDLSLIKIFTSYRISTSLERGDLERGDLEQGELEQGELEQEFEQSYPRPVSAGMKPPIERLDDDLSSAAVESSSSTEPALQSIKQADKHPATGLQSAADPSPQNTTSTVDNGTTARESAASVGLLDIHDELLFGGAYSDLFSVDPHMMQVDDDRVYILTYLLRHLSDFTVIQLQNGFPHNADPAVINRADPPRYLTVLETSDFDLYDLNDLDDLDNSDHFDENNFDEDELDRLMVEEAQLRQADIERPIDHQRQIETEIELDGLNAQVQVLHAKIELLSRKLEQVATS
ncbi:hypothetical protein [cf. Phormidesmis sp. LEGE 11477]|uniref:hypothetical protein n=1 Tax=cf. Phormidesmis sp. LEGE 11477 TaxID=1828680 RepID=UPI00187E9ABC|nr:hypothetical protein [cf. Phormidesmis sp. LEGE 11477]MBE9060531.1 hypothetical protein [cf. Phormidesmis sp. LEGE 11477]